MRREARRRPFCEERRVFLDVSDWLGEEERVNGQSKHVSYPDFETHRANEDRAANHQDLANAFHRPRLTQRIH